MVDSLSTLETSLPTTPETSEKPLLTAWLHKTSRKIKRLLERNKDHTVRLTVSDAIAQENNLGDARWVLIESGKVYTTSRARLLAVSESIRIPHCGE